MTLALDVVEQQKFERAITQIRTATSDVPLLTFLAPETLPIATGNLRPIFALAHQNSPALAFYRSFLI